MHALETWEELLAILFLHFSSLVFTQLHLQIHLSAIEIHLFCCSPLIRSQTWLPTLSSAASADIPPCSFFVSSPHPALSPRSLLLLPRAQFFQCLLFFIFSPIALLCRIVNTKHIIAPRGPRDFLVIAITMLAGLVMSLYSSLCPRSLQTQIKEGN